MTDKKMREEKDNRDVFEKALDDLQLYLPAAGVVSGAIAGRKISRAFQKDMRRVYGEEAAQVRNRPSGDFRYGGKQKQDMLEYYDSMARRPIYRTGGMRGAMIGGLMGYGASETIANERKRRKK